ncbi:helix-turn-helix domain-containing protein [Paenibacillus sp. NPDC058071]|uniref:response regulator transcription factor n=1 Tax=Paenibacillus sp. NPDC058071 TaxID=3346326 RepID=UPI0036DCE6A1
MHTVLLVDDDVAVLEFLEKMLPWDEYGFRVAGVCTNGLEALDVCRMEGPPDLIVTDIGMPAMDGVTLIKEVKAISDRPRFVILSCHDDFRYAQKAVQLGVQDYMLKETMELEALTELLADVKAKIDADERLQNEMRTLHSRASRSKSMLKEQWLRDWLVSPISDNAAWLCQLRGFGLQSMLPSFIPVIGRLHEVNAAWKRYENEDTVKFIVENIAEELLGQESQVIFISVSSREFCLLFNCKKELKNSPYEQARTLARLVQQKLEQIAKLRYSMLIGELEVESAGMRKQLLHMLQATERFFYLREPQFVTMEEANKLTFNDEEPLAFYYDYAERINRAIVEASIDVPEAVEPFIQFVSIRKFEPQGVKRFVFKLVLDTMMKLKDTRHYTNEKVQRELEQIGNIGELRVWLIGFVREAVGLMEEIAKQSKKVEIVDAQKYVRQNLDRKISLEEVAAHLHLNPSYFSRLFKKETGQNFIEYVTRSKMEKARELLNGSDRTMELVAQQLGYENKSYFVKLFKEHYGMLPSKYV